MLKFFNRIIALTELASGQLPFLGLVGDPSCTCAKYSKLQRCNAKTRSLDSRQKHAGMTNSERRRLIKFESAKITAIPRQFEWHPHHLPTHWAVALLWFSRG